VQAGYLRGDLLVALTANRTLTILEQLTYGLLVLLGHWTLGIRLGTQSLDAYTKVGRICLTIIADRMVVVVVVAIAIAITVVYSVCSSPCKAY